MDPDFERLAAEHDAYVAALGSAGLAVEVLGAEEGFPDSVFVEDVALVFSEGAILLRPGAPSRAAEAALIAPELERHFPQMLWLEQGHADGGDILATPEAVFIGLSKRTTRDGAEALAQLLAQLGKTAIVAETPGDILHFKTGCGMVDEETILVAPQLASCPAFAGLRVLVTPLGEEGAANILRLGSHLLIGAQWPRTRDLIERHGFATLPLPTMEIAKVDAGLSCMSLRWRS